ncbi:MAG: hypothetical protein ROZ00_15275 [Denitratisoma sp.]|nr:hypothetical protein [Denitratisoma sp.]
MKATRLLLILAAVAIAAFVSGWAFRAYLQPEAVVDFANRILFCN